MKAIFRINKDVRPYSGHSFEAVRRDVNIIVLNIDSKAGNSPMQSDHRLYRIDELTPVNEAAKTMLKSDVP